MYIEDIINYYKIKLDEHGVKRVQELSVLREHAELHGDTDKLVEYDQELNLIYGGNNARN
jgi:hypothetical protein